MQGIPEARPTFSDSALPSNHGLSYHAQSGGVGFDSLTKNFARACVARDQIDALLRVDAAAPLPSPRLWEFPEIRALRGRYILSEPPPILLHIRRPICQIMGSFHIAGFRGYIPERHFTGHSRESKRNWQFDGHIVVCRAWQPFHRPL